MNIKIAASGRKRKAAIKAVAKTRGKNLSQKTVTWMDGVDLRLHEIKDYWKKRNDIKNGVKTANGMRPVNQSPSGRPLRTSNNMQGIHPSLSLSISSLLSSRSICISPRRIHCSF